WTRQQEHVMCQTISSSIATGAAEQIAVAPQARLRDHVSARLHPRKLDLALAAGTPPECDAALSLRARRLTTLAHRRSIAQAIQGLVSGTGGAPAVARMRIRPLRGRVDEAGVELTDLAAKLAEPGPVAAQGAAQAELLLTDGTGALYNPARQASVRGLAANAT